MVAQPLCIHAKWERALKTANRQKHIINRRIFSFQGEPDVLGVPGLGLVTDVIGPGLGGLYGVLGSWWSFV